MERKEAVKVIKKNWPDSSFTMLREALETLITELKEDEDERIRKHLIGVVELYYGNTDEQEKKDCLAWLEKQGEQETVDEIAKEVCKNKESAVTFLKSTGIMNEKGELAEQYRQSEQEPSEEYNITGIGSKNAQGKLGKMIKNLKSVNEVLEQGSAWSEEDEKMIWAIPLVINAYPTKQEMFYGHSKEKLISWIKSIKDRVQLQDRINIEVWVTKNKQWILKLNGKVVRGQWGDEPQCIFKQFFYLSEIGSLKE